MTSPPAPITSFTPLRAGWILASAVTVAVLLCSMFFGITWHARQIAIASAYVTSGNLVLSFDQFVARTVETIDLSLQVVGEQVATGQARGQDTIQVLLETRVAKSPQLGALLVVGPDGRLRHSSSPDFTGPLDLSDTKYFIDARDSTVPVFVIGDPVLPGFSGKHLILIARRINDANGVFAGVVAATLNRDYIQRFIDTLDIGEHGIIALQMLDGTLLVRHPAIEEYIGKIFNNPALFQDKLSKSTSGTFEMRYRLDGLERIVGFHKLDDLPFVAQVGLSKDDALSDWGNTTLIQVCVGIAFLSVFGLMVFALYSVLHNSEAVALELEKARDAAEQSSRAKSQFMANMSHELRTPLNAVIGFSEMIRDAMIGPVDERYREYASDIRKSGGHLLSLINDVLDLSKVEAGQLELHAEPVVLADLVDDCRRLVAERVQTGGLRLTVEIPPDLPPLLVDRLRLKQIVLNLLSNSVKFTPGGGRIMLTAAVTAQGGVAISVSDTGIGMAAAEIPLALQPFAQVDSALNRRFEGTGLGLPLVRRLTELHGGRLDIASASGRGTAVTITLPASRVIGEIDCAVRPGLAEALTPAAE
jgi:two-component system, cell cycle sensor histidine kinase PleC